jgi:hypothetical protein
MYLNSETLDSLAGGQGGEAEHCVWVYVFGSEGGTINIIVKWKESKDGEEGG